MCACNVPLPVCGGPLRMKPVAGRKAPQQHAPALIRSWHWHTGVPLHLDIRTRQALEELPPDQLLKALSRGCIASVELHDSILRAPREMQSSVLSALTRSASTLTVLHSLRLEIANSQEAPLAAFTALRDLTLRHWQETGGILRAADLPSSLEEIRVELRARARKSIATSGLPPLVAFDRLRDLRRITYANYDLWDLLSCDDEGDVIPAQLPQSLEVCAVVPPHLLILASVSPRGGAVVMQHGAVCQPYCAEADRVPDDAACRSVASSSEEVIKASLPMQTVQLEAATIALQDISVDWPSSNSNDDEDGSGGGVSRLSPLGPVNDVTLEVGAEIIIDMVYTARPCPGAHRSIVCSSAGCTACCGTASDSADTRWQCQRPCVAEWRQSGRVAQLRPATADGSVPAFEGCGTTLPLGFAAIRLETNRLSCHATEQQPQARAGPEAARRSIDPVQLLCSALQLAPACYCRFELAFGRENEPLHVFGCVILTCWNATMSWTATATFESIAELAAAMQRSASAESLSMHLSADKQSIIVQRVEGELPGGAADVQCPT